MIYYITREELPGDRYKLIVRVAGHRLCVFYMPRADLAYVDFVSACRDRKITLIQTDSHGNEVQL